MRGRKRSHQPLLTSKLSIVAYLCILLISVSVASLAAQSTPSAYVRITPSTDPLENRYQTLIEDSFELALKRLGYVLRDDGDLELRVEVAMFSPRLHLSISAHDTESGALIGGINGSGRTNVTLLNSLDELFREIEPSLITYQESRGRGESPFDAIPEIRLLRFRGAEDVRIRVNHGPILGVMDDAELEVASFPVTQGSEVELRYEKPGSYPERERVTIEEGIDAIVVPTLQPRDRVAAQLHYTLGKLVGAGAGIRYYPIPDRLFVSTESDLFFSGVSPEAPYRVLHNEYRVLLGVRIVPPGAPLRFDVSSGGGVLFSAPLVGSATPFVDPYLNVANLGVEARIGRFRPFVRGGVAYAVGGRFALWQEGINPMLLSPSVLGGLRFVW